MNYSHDNFDDNVVAIFNQALLGQQSLLQGKVIIWVRLSALRFQTHFNLWLTKDYTPLSNVPLFSSTHLWHTAIRGMKAVISGAPLPCPHLYRACSHAMTLCKLSTTPMPFPLLGYLTTCHWKPRDYHLYRESERERERESCWVTLLHSNPCYVTLILVITKFCFRLQCLCYV